MLLFPGNAFYAAARKQLCAGRIGLDTLIAFGASVAFLFSLFNTFFPDYWLRVGDVYKRQALGYAPADATVKEKKLAAGTVTVIR